MSRNWEVTYPKTPATNGYLNYMLRASFGSRCDRYIPFTNCGDSSEVRSLVTGIIDIVGRWVPQKTAIDFDYSLHEAMNNVFDHAESSNGFWIHAQKYPEQRVIEIVIVDSGIGISESLRQNQTYSGLSTLESFRKALELQVTSKPDKNAGEGLSSILEWIKFNQNAGARGLVISKDNVWFCGQTQNGITNRRSIVWPGTFVWLCVPFIMENSLVDVWEILGLDPDE